MKKTIILHFVIIVSILLITGCGESPPLSQEEANQMMIELTTVINVETQNAMYGSMEFKKPVRAESVIYYTNDSKTILITGSISYDDDDGDGDTDMYPIEYTMNITLTNYIPQGSANISLLQGTMISTVYMESMLNFSSLYSGNFTTIYKGEEYECTWSFEMTYANGAYDYTGSYTINGYAYSY